jgi:serine/threonine-protein kinase
VASTVRFTISSVGSGGAAIERAAISPDGQNIVMAATLHDTSRLWIRRVDELDAHPVAGSEGATDPFFSPDGKWIGYVATDATVRKIPIEGGASIPLARFANAQGIAWVTPDTIIAGMALMSDRPGLTRISASGAQPTVLTKPVTEMHHYPVASADGRSVLFAIFADSGIKVGHLALGTARIDTIDVAGFRGTVPVALWGNRLIFRTFNGVWAADLDAGHRRVTSRVVKLIDRQDDLNSEESLARTGTVVNTRRRLRQSIIAVKPGGVADTIAEADADDYYTAPRWSPDRSVAAIFSLTLGRTVLVDRRSHISTRVGNGFGFMEPAWSSDGTRVVSNDTTTADSVAWWFWRDGRHPPERIAQAPSGWLIFGAIPSADERTVLLEVSRKSQRALYVTPLHGRASDARLLVQDAVNARWSPDARWIVYDARVNGRMEIFAQAIPSGGRIQLTESGGSHPVWPRGTNTLYYEVGQDIMAMDLDASASGLRVLRRRQVWHGRSAGERGDAAFTDYDVTPSGDLLLTSTRTAGRAEVVVEVNALAGAKGSRR